MRILLNITLLLAFSRLSMGQVATISGISAVSDTVVLIEQYSDDPWYERVTNTDTAVQKDFSWIVVTVIQSNKPRKPYTTLRRLKEIEIQVYPSLDFYSRYYAYLPSDWDLSLCDKPCKVISISTKYEEVDPKILRSGVRIVDYQVIEVDRSLYPDVEEPGVFYIVEFYN